MRYIPEKTVLYSADDNLIESVSGTGLGLNAPDGFTGNLVDFKINGVSKFRVSSLGSYQDSVHLKDLSGNNHLRIKSPDVLPGSVTWSLPSTDGQSNYVLITDGNGNLSFVKPGGGAVGGGNDFVFLENDNTVTTDYTLSTNKNAVSAGPVTINSGVTVTVPSGQSWVIV